MERDTHEADEQRERAVYATPVLIRFGTVAAITRSQAQKGNYDGGHPPHSKTN